jgi:hypothetical protein
MTSSAHRANALPSNINRFRVRQSHGGTQPLAAVLMALIYHGQVHEPWRLREAIMRMVNLSAAALAAVCCGAISVTALADDMKEGYKGVPRTFLWNPGPIEFTDTTKYKKPGRWVIGFSNASISNAWAVANLHSVQYAASQHKDTIKQLIITDANDDPNCMSSEHFGPWFGDLREYLAHLV